VGVERVPAEDSGVALVWLGSREGKDCAVDCITTQKVVKGDMGRTLRLVICGDILQGGCVVSTAWCTGQLYDMTMLPGSTQHACYPASSRWPHASTNVLVSYALSYACTSLQEEKRREAERAAAEEAERKAREAAAAAAAAAAGGPQGADKKKKAGSSK
jgi:hypothetical protein